MSWGSSIQHRHSMRYFNALPQHRLQGRGHLGGCRRDLDAGSLERGALLLGRPFAAGDDGPSVSHALAGGGRRSGDESCDRLLHARLDVSRGALFGLAADLADHDYAVGTWIGVEERQDVDEVQARHRIAADADAGGLTNSEGGELAHGLVGERTRSRDDPNPSRAVDVPGHDADLASPGGDDPRAVWADEPRGLVLEPAAHA